MTAEVACGPAAAFPCNTDDDCIAGSVFGVCQPAGFCSFPDADCASGQRYGAHAGGGLAQDCVDVGTTTSADATTAGDGTRGDTSTSIASLDTTVSTTATATSSVDTSETTSTGGCPGDWADCGHPYRRPLVVSGTADVVEGFAVPWRFNLLELTDDPTPGHDPLRFTDAFGELLPVDYEASDLAGNTVAWIRVPKVEGPTRLFVYYGGAPATEALQPVTVWTPEYLEVWHGDGQPGRVMGLLLEEDDIVYGEGRFGSAPDFNGQSSRMRDETLTLFPPVVTITGWTFARSFGEITFGRVFDSREAAGGGNGFSVIVSDVNQNSNTISMVHGCEDGDAEWVAPDDTIRLAVWQHLAVSFDAARGVVRPIVYVDGASTPLEELYGDPCEPLAPPAAFAIGNVAGTLGRTYDGVIDEVRIYDGLPNAARVALEYASGSPTFVAVGDEQSQL